MSPGQRFSFFRVSLIAGNTLRAAWRQRLLAFLVVLAPALVVAGRGLGALNFGASELKFLCDLGFGALAFFGAVLAIVATAQLFFHEIEHRTVLTLLAKPVRRSEFLLGKLAGVSVVLALYAVVMTALIAAVLWSSELALGQQSPGTLGRDGGVKFATLAAAGAAQWLKLELLAGWTLLIASFARTQLFAIVNGFLILVICHLQFIAQTAAARSDGWLTRVAGGALGRVFPDFQLFDLSGRVVGAGGGWTEFAWLAAYSAGHLLVLVALAAACFRKREF